MKKKLNHIVKSISILQYFNSNNIKDNNCGLGFNNFWHLNSNDFTGAIYSEFFSRSSTYYKYDSRSYNIDKLMNSYEKSGITIILVNQL